MELVVLQDVQKPQEQPTPSQKKTERMETLGGKAGSPTTKESKVKFTTVVTLEKTHRFDLGAPETTHGNIVKEAPADKKPNMMVILTLEKENSSSSSSSSRRLDQQHVRSAPVRSPPSISASLTQDHSEQQDQESTVESVRDLQYAEDGGSLSPDVGDDEGPPPSPPSSARIRKIKKRVKAQSRQKDLVQMNGSGTQAGESAHQAYDNKGFESSDDKKPIIVILNEPMDIQSAYKRLSTIFESEEELAEILSAESIVHEERLKQEEEEPGLRKLCITEIKHQGPDNGSVPENQKKSDSPKKTETKKKFKFKFPKNKLAAISQAIRTGSKPGKKTLEVVVYEEVEERVLDSRQWKETRKQTKESRGCETSTTQHCDSGESESYDREDKVSSARLSASHSRVEELCKTALDSIGSLEESIKQLEISVSSISAPSSPSALQSSPPRSPAPASADRTQHKDVVSREREGSPPKRPAPHVVKGSNPPQSKKAKPQPQHDTGKPFAKKQV